MCVSNGIEISCAFTKVKLADGFGKKKTHTFTWMSKNPCKREMSRRVGYARVLHTRSAFFCWYE